MSKRARITLNPETRAEPETEPEPDTVATPRREPGPRPRAGEAGAGPATAPTPAIRAPSAATLVKLVLAGLTVAAALLLWKNRRL